MPYQLREDLTYCQIGDDMIFLDITNDHYFQPSGAITRALKCFFATGLCSNEDMSRLTDCDILVEANEATKSITPPPAIRPTRSALEIDRLSSAPTMLDLAETSWIVASTRRHLRTRRIKLVLDDLVSLRIKRLRALGHDMDSATELAILRASMTFYRARRYVPIEPSCLLDSIALVRFLSRRRLPANIVFGVMLNPFAAHCWVQAESTALNETVSDANAYTPIKVV